jgi:hypothetical protein
MKDSKVWLITGGSSMTMHQPGPDYHETVGRIHEYHRAANGTEPGDPDRAADVIARVVDLAEPPRRLLLGSDALDMALAASAQSSVEAERWAELSRSADFPGGN